MPTRDELEQSRILRPIAHRVLHSSLWRFTRRSVPRGVALGLLVGIFLLIPGLQIAGAALLALPFRANVPIAAAMTFLSNPATTPFILYLSVLWGNSLLGRGADVSGLMALVDSGAPISAWVNWLLSDAAPALLLGLSIISILAALIGYVISIAGWRWWIVRKWQKRQQLRKEMALNPPVLEQSDA